MFSTFAWDHGVFMGRCLREGSDCDIVGICLGEIKRAASKAGVPPGKSDASGGIWPKT